ncbi:MAG: putative iron-sulfur protein, partial [Acidimicrobiales bacterium]|nr:putative iron-sulfur protein [Acidimicrobiales bacterium]
MNDILCGNTAFASAWYAVARGIEVGATPRKITLLSRDVVLYRSADGSVVAAPDRCPHREAPLSKGTI